MAKKKIANEEVKNTEEKKSSDKKVSVSSKKSATKKNTENSEKKKSPTKKKVSAKKDNEKSIKKKTPAKKKVSTKKDTKESTKKKTSVKKTMKKKTPAKNNTTIKTKEKPVKKPFASVKKEEEKKSQIGALLIFLIALMIPVLLFMAETIKVDIPTINLSAKVVQVLSIFPILILTVLALIVTKFSYQKISSFSLTEELTDNDNPAVGLSLAGYLFGMALGLVGAMSHIRHKNFLDTFPDIVNNLIPGFVITLILLIVAQKVLDHLILHRFSIDKELATDRNLGTGAICCGGFIATGLILMSSFSQTIDNGILEYTLAIVSTFVVGQIIFVFGGWTFAKISKFDFHYEIEERDNVSAGILFGGLLIGIGLVISASITNVEWKNTAIFYTESVTVLDDNLSDKTVNKEMLAIFHENKCPLNPKATIEPTEPNEWKIKNPEYYIQYKIKKQKNYLAVYSDNVLFLTIRKATTTFFAGILAILLLLFIGLWAAKLFFFRVSLEEEVRQKNPAVALILACTYIVTGLIIQVLLKI